MNEGWTCAYRKIWEHPIFAGNAQRVGVFQWMVHMAAWKPTRFNAGGQIITLERGQLCVSQAQICEATGITRKALRTFLDTLKAEGAIGTKAVMKRAKGRTIITICNYDKYQDSGDAKGQERAKQGPTKEQGNNISVPYGTDVPLRKQVFDKGKEVLRSAGVKNPGALINKWLSSAGEAEVLAAILAGHDRNDPVAFITSRLKRTARHDESTDDYLAKQGIRDLENGPRNFRRGGDTGPPSARLPANDLPGVFAHQTEEERPVSFRDVQAGRDCLELLALRA